MPRKKAVATGPSKRLREPESESDAKPKVKRVARPIPAIADDDSESEVSTPLGKGRAKAKGRETKDIKVVELASSESGEDSEDIAIMEAELNLRKAKHRKAKALKKAGKQAMSVVEAAPVVSKPV